MRVLWVLVLLAAGSPAFAQFETDLYDGAGRAAGFIGSDGTIYLWSGRPVAYLDRYLTNDVHVYGFNGRHLGWFARGVIRDHRGDAACATRDVIRMPQPGPFKGVREFPPMRQPKEPPPFAPFPTFNWSRDSCERLLRDGF